MLRFLEIVDRHLRGESSPSSIGPGDRAAGGQRSLWLAVCALGGFYGACMGLFALLRRPEPAWNQFALAVFKVPALFVGTLLVTFPSLYVCLSLARSRLDLRAVLGLLLGATAVISAALASLGTVTAFFTLSTKSYPFMLVLNVVFFAASGLVGLAFARRALKQVLEDQSDRLARSIFGLWLFVYALVGAQMSWVLRPFVGDPAQPIEIFRPTESHFLRGVLDALQALGS